MIHLRHPLAVLAGRLPRATLEATFAPLFAKADRTGRSIIGDDLLGSQVQIVGAGVAAAGRPRLPMRLLLSLPRWTERTPRWTERTPRWTERTPRWTERTPRWTERKPRRTGSALLC